MSDLTSLEKDQVYRVRGALTSIKKGWPLLQSISLYSILLMIGGVLVILITNSVLIQQDSSLSRDQLIGIMVVDVVALLAILIGLLYFLHDVGVQTSIQTKL